MQCAFTQDGGELFGGAVAFEPVGTGLHGLGPNWVFSTIMTAKKWSKDVTEQSDALDLEPEVFKGTAKEIAQSLKRSAEHSKRRKAEPYRSAMSMLAFYINRAGKNLPDRRRRTLERAKDELRALYGRD